MDMQWTQLRVTGAVQDLETISAVMSMVNNSLMIEDYSDVTTDGMYGALLDESLLNADKTRAAVSVFIPETQSVAEGKAFIETHLAAAGIPYEMEVVGCREEDWAEAWKKYYHPIKVGKIVIVPAWEDYTPAPGEVTVTMDPGMAFGTGTHETTRLVISMLEKYLKPGDRMLDVGTGSGNCPSAHPSSARRSAPPMTSIPPRCVLPARTSRRAGRRTSPVMCPTCSRTSIFRAANMTSSRRTSSPTSSCA